MLGACTEEISAEIPSAEDRAWLNMPRTAALLVVRRKTFTHAGQAVEFGRASYRGDLYSAIIHSARSRRT
jgi:DNA-binding GntR family transcriptional regulator